MKKVLTIAGSDPSGGAGIQADLKTMETHGVYGMSVITALTAQNTMGVTGKLPVSAEFVREQLLAVYDDIFPDAVKIGMLPDAEVMSAVKDVLTGRGQKNIVLDPVLSSTSGTKLSLDEAMSFLKNELFSVCTLITPNIPEAEKLTQLNITSKETMEEAAKMLGDECGCSVLLKGGHMSFTPERSDDLLYHDSSLTWFTAKRLDNSNTHGTGCTLSSAIACNLAKGLDIKEAVKEAKGYLLRCIEKGLDLGKGRGPLEHRA